VLIARVVTSLESWDVQTCARKKSENKFSPTLALLRANWP
jgi:hypothetical protein